MGMMPDEFFEAFVRGNFEDYQQTREPVPNSVESLRMAVKVDQD